MIGDEVRDRCFTFGFGQRLIPVDSAGHVWPTDGVSLANGYVIVRGTRAQALEAMRRRFGQVWSFDYEDALVAGVERYGLWQVLPPIDATGIVDVEPVADPARAVADKPGSGPARVIMGQTMSRCSVCGGNADPNELTHLHGGRESGWHDGSSLADTNGCGVVFEAPPENPYARRDAAEPVVIIGHMMDGRPITTGGEL